MGWTAGLRPCIPMTDWKSTNGSGRAGRASRALYSSRPRNTHYWPEREEKRSTITTLENWIVRYRDDIATIVVRDGAVWRCAP